MKRNETVLVYAVTGLLLVILLVAVVFGGNPAEATENPASREAARLPGGVIEDLLDPVADDAEIDSGAKADPGTSPVTPSPEPKGDDLGGAEQPDGGKGDAEAKPRELEARVALPAEELESTFGSSRRTGSYRVVPATAGSTLESVVTRWCGSKDHLAEAETLNEALVGEQLSAGQEVLVPWVAPEVLLAAERERRAEQAKIEFAKGEPYTLQRGDSLWKLAEQRVSRRMVPAWIEQFKKLNPDVTDPGRLVEGQKVRLPRS